MFEDFSQGDPATVRDEIDYSEGPCHFGVRGDVADYGGSGGIDGVGSRE